MPQSLSTTHTGKVLCMAPPNIKHRSLLRTESDSSKCGGRHGQRCFDIHTSLGFRYEPYIRNLGRRSISSMRWGKQLTYLYLYHAQKHYNSTTT
ncbi:hypothetical protein BDW74DRAFT_149384 [Aspergillus multicolor]|uniref:uncharacterized protein n=1 Tax=Aspergillus multicolor TaxID=41759 RepID=UPI003CCDA2AB